MLDEYLAEVRELVQREIVAIVPRGRYGPMLYDLMLEYPLRSNKALRPALCVATCRALGGRLQDVLPTAAVIELYHNAFLIHDDIEDASMMRRGRPTLHREFGVPVAINVGDAMLALALKPLLDNAEVLGLGKALRLLDIVARMARESAEGQALELDWVRRGEWNLGDSDYWHMVYKKTCWYTFIAPMLVGATVSGGTEAQRRALRRLGIQLGIAFQIHDDILNLSGDELAYGKEINGDLYEGKRTLILLHTMRQIDDHERREATRVLSKPPEQKSAEEVAWLRGLIERHGSIAYAAEIARSSGSKALAILEGADWLAPSQHKTFLTRLVHYVMERER